ncbi:MAG TPA: alpha/beta family hydrolase [Rhodanobacteraceae bacterium]|nr:alpha/beta family hydrolase [Rhodanobacteraceae bacterium]
MPGHVILSHGSDSGPGATKVSALARVAESTGWSTFKPDYRGEDALGHADSVPLRVARLVDAMRDAKRPLVLAGSSMGAFVSGLASRQARCDGLFLMALPIEIPGCPQRFEAAPGAPGLLVHGWRDELCPVDAAIAFARARGMPTLLLDDDHRLGDHLALLERQFGLFLQTLVA